MTGCVLGLQLDTPYVFCILYFFRIPSTDDILQASSYDTFHIATSVYIAELYVSTRLWHIPSRGGTLTKTRNVANIFPLLRSCQIATFLRPSTLRLGCAKAVHKSTVGCLSARLPRHRFLFPSRKSEQSREFIHFLPGLSLS